MIANHLFLGRTSVHCESSEEIRRAQRWSLGGKAFCSMSIGVIYMYEEKKHKKINDDNVYY